MQNEDRHVEPIEIDYTLSASALFITVTRKILHSPGSLRICGSALERLQGTGLGALPRGYPTGQKVPATLPFEFLNRSAFYFSADRKRSYAALPGEQQVLTAWGPIIDNIVDLIDSNVPESIAEQERRDFLIHDLLPLLISVLTSSTKKTNLATVAYTAIRTITLDGFTRKCNQGDFGLPDTAWSESTCAYMLS
jgi:hypothetical protein